MQLSFQEDAIFLVREKVAGGTSIKEISSCTEQGRTGRRPRCIRQSITKKMEGWKAINSASAQPGWVDGGPKSGPLLFAKASEAGIAQTEKGRSRSSSKIHDSCSVLHMKDGPISSAREARREGGTSKGQIPFIQILHHSRKCRGKTQWQILHGNGDFSSKCSKYVSVRRRHTLST